MNLKVYKKELPFTYVEGFYPILEAIRYRKKHIRKIILHSKAKDSRAAATIQQNMPAHLIEWSDSVLHRFASHDYCLAMAVVDKYEDPIIEGNNCVVLYQPSDMGNMGTIIRTMTAFSFFDLILIKPAADCMNPKAIRASMGSIFQMRVTYLTLEEFLKRKVTIEKTHWYAFDKSGKTTLSQTQFLAPTGLIFGNEGSGLTPELKAIGETVSIPQASKVDSLNLSVSTGIVLYQVSVSGAPKP